MLDNATEINPWQRLLVSPEWKAFRDLVESERAEAMERLLLAATPEMVKFFQGRALALKDVLELPETQLALSHHLDRQDDALGQSRRQPEVTREEEEEEDHDRRKPTWFQRFAARR